MNPLDPNPTTQDELVQAELARMEAFRAFQANRSHDNGASYEALQRAEERLKVIRAFRECSILLDLQYQTYLTVKSIIESKKPVQSCPRCGEIL